MTTEQLLSLPTRDRAIFAIGLMYELFELEDCFSAFNFSRYMLSADDVVMAAFDQQGSSDDLSAEEKHNRLVALLSSLTPNIPK